MNRKMLRLEEGMMLQGTYGFDDVVKIDCNNAYAQVNVYIHEMAH